MDNSTVAAIGKALGDPNRLRIVQMLSEGEKCACRILEKFEITQPTLSHHMKVLEACGLINDRKDGHWHYYSLNTATLKQYGDFVEHLMSKKKVAFICVHNACRSQIAEALGRYFASDVFDSYSAGTEKQTQINQDAVRIMKAMYGIDMEQRQFSKLTSEIPKPDLMISMGCGVHCPYVGRPFDDDWNLEDPTGKSDEDFVRTIKTIEKNILKLKEKLTNE